MKIGILGIPFNGDGTRPEIENPAAALREAGLSRLQIRSGDKLLDYGDLEIPVFDGHRDPSHSEHIPNRCRVEPRCSGFR